jgi:hypothetical protein
VVDISGRGYHGQVHGAEYGQDDVLGGTMSFDGDDDYISIQGVSLSQFTFSAWVKTETTGTNNRRIFQLSDDRNCYTVEGNGSGGVGSYVTKGIEINEYNWRFNPGTWAHVTVTFDGSSLKIYIYGILTEARSGTFEEGIEGTAYIGGIGSFGGGFWNGSIDEVAVFNRALTEDEVWQLFSMTGEQAEVPIHEEPADNIQERDIRFELAADLALSGSDAPYRGEQNSDVLTDLPFSIPRSATEVRIDPHQARGEVSVAQAPSQDNDYELVIKFDDGPQTSSVWYEVVVYISSPGGWPVKEFSIHIKAYIDGVSNLVFKDNTVYWHHLSDAAPGRHEGRNLPTYINDIEWFPEWPQAGETESTNTILLNTDESINEYLSKSSVANSESTGAQTDEEEHTEHFEGVSAGGRPIKAATHSILGLVPGTFRDSLLLYYSFYSDADPTTVIDISGRGLHGRVQDAAYEQDDVLGGTMAFDGEDDYITLPDMYLGNFTFAAWIKTAHSGGYVNNRAIFQMRDDRNDRGIGGNSRGGVSYGCSGYGFSEYNWQFRQDTWTYVTVTCDGRTGKIYKNGILTELSTGNFIKEIRGQAHIGGVGTQTGGSWHGSIDEVALFNRVLTDDEVWQLFSMTGEQAVEPEAEAGHPESSSRYLLSSLSGPDEDDSAEHFKDVVADGHPTKGGGSSVTYFVPAGLQANLAVYYSFYSDADPETVTDISGSGFHARVHGARYITDDVLGGAMYFDGENDHISTPDVFLHQFTFSAWVSPGGDGLNNRRIFMLTDGTKCYALQGNAGGCVGVFVADGVEINEYNWRLADNTWTHITVTHDGQTFSIYKNGILTEAGDIKTTGVTGTLHIGGTEQQSGGFWHGSIDEVAFFSRALTEDEVWQLFSTTGALVE